MNAFGLEELLDVPMQNSNRKTLKIRVKNIIGGQKNS